ncbi:MAG TPA: NUDIX domain-containing protein [Polyangiaceae bacterium]|nr:NUDIX domain-containing protein [Polyangiaceae bacterium]
MAPLSHDDVTVRSSHVAYVFAKLRVRGDDYLLLNAHRKWGDWSLPGGHVEAFDESWQAAAMEHPVLKQAKRGPGPAERGPGSAAAR